MKTLFVLITLGLFCMNFTSAKTPMVAKYDHQFHEQKVFKVYKIACTECHNLSQNNEGKLQVTEALNQATFKKTFKMMCHECHQGTKYPEAPKGCILCHDSRDRLMQIKPLSHENSTFKDRHAMEARSFGGQCLNCHTNTQCVKCHSSRNPVMNQNHSRNYKYYHSIEARMSPHQCDTCHTQTYCIRCHVGVR